MSFSTKAFSTVVTWLAAHADFPRARLTPKSELLVCMAALAQAESAAEESGATGHIQRKDPAQAAALRTHALRRSQVHFKCDNSAKV